MRDLTASLEIPTAHRLFFTDELRHDPRRAHLEDSFFHSLVLRNGTFKTTWHRRLDDLNELIARVLPPERPLEIMDVAVSSGISTIEWLEALEHAGIECRMTAGDAIIDAFLVTAGPLRGLFDRTRHLMQLDIAGRAVRMPAPRRRDRLRYAPLALFLQGAARAFHRDSKGLGRAPAATRLGLRCQPLKLISPALAAHPRIEIIEDDILVDRRWPRRFDVLRAANVLNPCYFGDALLRRMLRNLRSRLAPRGVLAVCRTSEDGRNDASAFGLRDDRTFVELRRLNAGSEIAPLVLSLPPEP